MAMAIEGCIFGVCVHGSILPNQNLGGLGVGGACNHIKVYEPRSHIILC